MSTRAQIRFATREVGVSFNEHPNAIHAQFYNIAMAIQKD